MDSIDLTVNNGDFQLQIAGISYPQKPLSTSNNKSGIMNELRRAMGSIFGNNVAMAINAAEFGRVGTSVTTFDKPGKFWVGINLQKLTIPSKAFFTGVQLKTRRLPLLLTLTPQQINYIM